MDKRKEPALPREEDVLKRMLSTPPAPHKAPAKAKPKKRPAKPEK